MVWTRGLWDIVMDGFSVWFEVVWFLRCCELWNIED